MNVEEPTKSPMKSVINVDSSDQKWCFRLLMIILVRFIRLQWSFPRVEDILRYSGQTCGTSRMLPFITVLAG